MVDSVMITKKEPSESDVKTRSPVYLIVEKHRHTSTRTKLKKWNVYIHFLLVYEQKYTLQEYST